MKIILSKGSVAVVAAGLICSMANSGAFAQSRGTIAICPANFDHGTKTARMTAMKSIQDDLQREGFTVILPADNAGPIASQDDIKRYANQMNAQFVLKPVISFHSRSIWVDLGPRTNSTADVDVTITNAATGQVVYSRDAKARSDEKFNAGKAAADVVFTPLVTTVSGGPKAPHEQRAAQIAVYRALKGFQSNI